jgi:hypothetical protein
MNAKQVQFNFLPEKIINILRKYSKNLVEEKYIDGCIKEVNSTYNGKVILHLEISDSDFNNNFSDYDFNYDEVKCKIEVKHD